MHASGQRLLALFLPCVVLAAACGGSEETEAGNSLVGDTTTVTQAPLQEQQSGDRLDSESAEDTGDAVIEEEPATTTPDQQAGTTTTAPTDSVDTTATNAGDTVIEEPTTIPENDAPTTAPASARSDEDRIVSMALLIDAGRSGWSSNGAEVLAPSPASGETCGMADPDITEGYAGDWEGPDGTTLAQIIQSGPGVEAWIPAFLNLVDCSTSDVPPMRLGEGAVDGADDVAILEPNGSDEDGGYAAAIVAQKGEIVVAFVVETNDSASPALATDFLITLAESALAD